MWTDNVPGTIDSEFRKRTGVSGQRPSQPGATAGATPCLRSTRQKYDDEASLRGRRFVAEKFDQSQCLLVLLTRAGPSFKLAGRSRRPAPCGKRPTRRLVRNAPSE